MDHRTVPNYNQIQIQFLSDFVEGVLEQLPDDSFPEVRDHIRKSVSLFLEQLSFFEKHPKRGQILELENLRNEQLESLLDRLDDHLNVFIDDPENDLSRISLTESEIMQGLSGFREAVRLLGVTTEGEPDFHSRFDRTGHVWEELRYREFLNRLESGEYEEEAEVLGIAGKALQLLALDHRQETIVQEENCSEELKEIRKIRLLIREDLEPLFHELYDEKLFAKPHNRIPVIELLMDDLNARNEATEMEKFSYNDFSHREILTLWEDIELNEISDERKTEYELLEKELVSAYRKMVQRYSEQEVWKEFEQSEIILYHCLERFFWEIPGTINCVGYELYSELKERFRTTSRYRAAENLHEILVQDGIHLENCFVRGSLLFSSDIPLVIDAFTREEVQKELEELRLTPLAKEIAESDARSRELLEPLVHQFNMGTVDELRQYRTEMTRYLILI